MPLPSMIGKKATRMWKAAEDANRTSARREDVLLLFTDPTPFKSEIFLSVTGVVPGEDNVTISGSYVSKVFDGPYNAIPKYIKEMDRYLSEKGKRSKRYYVHYAYCPKCARKYSHNHMVLFAEV